MRVHVLQHVPFEGLGSIDAWLAGRNSRITWTRFFDDPTLPPPDEIDLLIALGGPMSVNDEAILPWLRDEKRFIAAVIAAGTPVLGICLGAQLIASAHGAPVHANDEKEIGWFPVVAEPPTPDCFALPPSIEVFHWHGETFELPAGAVHLARSAACRHQAFQLGPRVIGLQFHLEMTPESAAALVCHCGDELVPQRFVQPAADLLAVPPARYAAINGLMGQLLDFLLRHDG